MHKATEVAKYFLAKADVTAGDTFSNLYIQKLLYYAQGFSLVLNKRPVFEEQIEAWTHGPVVPEVFHAFKHYGNQALPIPKDFDFSQFTVEEQSLLDDVYDVYGQFSAWKIRDIAFIPDGPWNLAYELGKNNVITQESLIKYFRTQITEE